MLLANVIPTPPLVQRLSQSGSILLRSEKLLTVALDWVRIKVEVLCFCHCLYPLL